MATDISASILRIGITPDAQTPGMMIPPPMFPAGPNSPYGSSNATPFEDIIYLTVMLDWPYTGNLQIGIKKAEVGDFLVGGKLILSVKPGDPNAVAVTQATSAGRAFSVGLAPNAAPPGAPPGAPTGAQTPTAQDPSSAPQPPTPAQLGGGPAAVTTAQ